MDSSHVMDRTSGDVFGGKALTSGQEDQAGRITWPAQIRGARWPRGGGPAAATAGGACETGDTVVSGNGFGPPAIPRHAGADRDFPPGPARIHAKAALSESCAAASGAAASAAGEAFERAYAGSPARHCLATANGSTALLTSLYALDVGAGDEVIVPPYTFVATVNAVLLRGALPIFVDSDLETFQIDARRIEPAITDRTRVIVPVHLGGSAADLDPSFPAQRRRCRLGTPPAPPRRMDGPQVGLSQGRLLQLPCRKNPTPAKRAISATTRFIESC